MELHYCKDCYWCADDFWYCICLNGYVDLEAEYDDECGFWKPRNDEDETGFDIVKRFSTACDIGSVLIGDENWTFAVPNIGGDGATSVHIYSTDKEFNDDSWSKGMRFISSVQGRFGIFDYDCAFNELLSGRMTIDDAVMILNGRYGVYQGDWKVAFVRWESYQ